MAHSGVAQHPNSNCPDGLLTAMPLPEGLLNPIPGDNPSGKTLRYDPVYDKIREARREENVLPQGDWSREVKKASTCSAASWKRSGTPFTRKSMTAMRSSAPALLGGSVPSSMDRYAVCH